MKRTIEELIAASSLGAAMEDIAERGIDAHLADLETDMNNEELTALQRESARVNEMGGVIAHLVGVLAEVHRATSVETARTFAEIALANIEAWHAGTWLPGPGDDAADWSPRHWAAKGGA